MPKHGTESRATIDGVPVFCAFDSLVDIGKIVGNPRNPNQHPDNQIQLLSTIIKGQGWRAPITVSVRSGFVVRGHGRLAAAQRLGLSQVPVDYQQYETEASEWADLIADNRVAELAEIDNEKLADLINELETGDISLMLTGYDEDAVRDLIRKVDVYSPSENAYDDDIPELPEEPVSQPGDIWYLGDHILMCGDSVKSPEHVATLMGNDKAQMIFADPPWNVNYGSDEKHPSWKSRQILNDKMSTDDFNQFLFNAFANIDPYLPDGAMVYVVMSAQEWGNIMDAMCESGFHWSSTIIWAKDQLVLSRKDYHTQYEPIWYGWKNGSRICPLDNTRSQSDLWEFPRPKRSEEHPTMKPIDLVVRAIQNSSYKGDIIVDQFGGSGTTLLAAEQTGRKCRMMELDPKYCDVIVQRFAKVTGKTDSITLVRARDKYIYNNIFNINNNNIYYNTTRDTASAENEQNTHSGGDGS